MSTLQTTNLKNPSSASNNIVLDSSGRVLVNTATGHGTLQVHDGTFVLSKPGGGSDKNWRFLPSDAAAGDLAIQQSTTSGGTTYATKLTIDPSGRLLVGTSTATANGGVLELSGGITFPATAVAASNANTLDDYEEGTWTPSVGGNATYSSQDGKYTKIGNTVYIQGQLNITTLGTGSTTTLSGLPFASGAGNVEGGLTVTYFAALAVNVISLVLGVNASSTNTTAYSRTTAGAASSSVAIYGNSARIFFYGHYFI